MALEVVTLTMAFETPTPGEHQQAMWIFGAAGLPFLLAGGIQMFLMGRSPLLVVGVVLGIIPTILVWLIREATPVLQWSLIGMAVLGLVWCGATVGRWLGWWDWKRKAGRAAMKLEAGMNGATPEEANRLRRTAELLEHIGSKTFNVNEVEAP